MSVDREHIKGLFLTLTAVFILSPDALLVRLIGLDTWTLLFWRGLLSGSTLLISLLCLYRREMLTMIRVTGRLGLLSATSAACGNIFFVSSLYHTTAANTLVILASTPLLAALISRIFTRETIPRRTWIAICTAFFGILTLFAGSLNGQFLFGDLLAVCAATCWASTLVIVRCARPLNMIPANAFGNLLVTPIAFIAGATPLAVSPVDFGLLLILGMLVLPISYALITLAPRLLPAPEISLTLLLETVLGPFWVWLVVGEEPASATLIGGALILGTLAVHTLGGIYRKPAPADGFFS